MPQQLPSTCLATPEYPSNYLAIAQQPPKCPSNYLATNQNTLATNSNHLTMLLQLLRTPQQQHSNGSDSTLRQRLFLSFRKNKIVNLDLLLTVTEMFTLGLSLLNACCTCILFHLCISAALRISKPILVCIIVSQQLKWVLQSKFKILRRVVSPGPSFSHSTHFYGCNMVYFLPTDNPGCRNTIE